ncbi:hypothetical protein FXO38_33417 [Capsicum annuum]|uniref:Replication factor A C-terminal domain-containing protein n=1 Tax=Capsicum annuum TaxID=4072 RepID=A0A2G2ZQX9_CAPAN|nr:hypothetical protein FXO38_33417 [Capsicum annuum]KAF3666956.1 hypothetical protein FXO37_10264 [Capsicum annuum]PHT84365.1 hypothetical protein T459_12808 [Capsicum annuum]
MDGTGSISLIIWDNDAMSLIGKSENDLKEELLQVIVKNENIQNHDEDLIKKYSPNESDISSDDDITNSKELYEESSKNSDRLTSLKTYAKRNRSSKKDKSIIVDENIHGQLSSNKIHKDGKKKKKSSSAASK